MRRDFPFSTELLASVQAQLAIWSRDHGTIYDVCTQYACLLTDMRQFIRNMSILYSAVTINTVRAQ